MFLNNETIQGYFFYQTNISRKKPIVTSVAIADRKDVRKARQAITSFSNTTKLIIISRHLQDGIL